MKGCSPLCSVGDEKERLQLLKKVVDKLPKPNADNLKYVQNFVVKDGNMSLSFLGSLWHFFKSSLSTLTSPR